jgi:hypothetical protein
MRRNGKLAAVSLIAALAAWFAAGAASANTIAAAPSGAITATSLGRLVFAGRGGIEISINCRVTLRGSVNRTIGNGAGGRVGSITEGSTNECNVGAATPLASAANPWPLVLTAATNLAVSPKLAEITVERATFQVSGILGQTCLYEGNVPTTLEGEGPRERVVTRLQTIRANSERIVRNSGLCPERGELSGSGFGITTQTLSLEGAGGEEEAGCRTPPAVVERVNDEAVEVTETLRVTAQCNGTRIRNISTRRPSVIAINDRAGAIGREFARGVTFSYELILRDQPGTGTYNDEVLIETSRGNAITRVTFRNQ